MTISYNSPKHHMYTQLDHIHDRLAFEESCTLTDAEAYQLLLALFGNNLTRDLEPVISRLKASGMGIPRAASNAAANAPLGSLGRFACQTVRYLAR